MTRFFRLIFLCLGALIACPLFAQAYTGCAFVTALNENRLNSPVLTLYALPDPASDVVADLFPGVRVDVIEDDGGPFLRVRAGGYEGYALRLALHLGEAGLHPDAAGELSAVTPPLPLTSAPLREDADENAAIITEIPLHAYVQTQLLTPDWAYVTYEATSGFVRTDFLRQADNFADSVLSPRSPDQRVSLYAVPGDPASLLGEYFGYLTVYNQFESASVPDSWMRVMIGRVCGFVCTDDVQGSSTGIVAPFLPPLVQTSQNTALYASPDFTSVLETIPSGTVLEILGAWDSADAYHVRWGALDAFVSQSDLSGVPDEARWNPALSLYETRCETPLYASHTRREIQRMLPAGTRFYRLSDALNGDLPAYMAYTLQGEAGDILQDDALLVSSGIEQPDVDSMHCGYRTRYAVQGAVLRDQPSEEGVILGRFSGVENEDPLLLLGGVLPGGYIRVRSTGAEAREGYILAASLDSTHW